MLDLIFAKTYNFPIMEKNNINHVFEDSFKISSNAFCIADGITRDLINGDAFFYPKTKEKALELTKKYPNPSGASQAAKICTENFINYTSNLDLNKIKVTYACNLYFMGLPTVFVIVFNSSFSVR